MKKFAALALSAVMALSLAACGGSESAAPAAGGDSAAASTGDVVVSVFNSKSEIQDKFVEMAAEYSASHEGVTVEVYYSSDTVAAHMATRYSSGEPYAIAMVDAKDVYSLGAEHALDLSDQEWVKNTTGAIEVDGKVLGFPVCVEARGIMYNAEAIKNITGEDFDPQQYKTLDAFTGLLDQLVAGGMTAPVGIMKEDWSLAAHYLSMVYEMQDDVNAFVDGLYAGEIDLAADAKYNELMDTFDVLKKYNYAAASPIAAEREVSEQKLAEGEIAFMFGGNWDWSLIADFAANGNESNMGMMGIPMADEKTNDVLVGGASKYFYVDNAESLSDETKQAAKDFLNWLVFDEAGNKFLTEDCALVPAFSNIDASALDPLSKAVKSYVDAGKTIASYNYAPDDHYSKLGASMQKYLADQIDRAGLAGEIVDYWKSTTPVAR